MSPGKSNSRGSIILFNNNFEYDILRTKIDLKGNLVAVELKLHGTFTLTLINIYGPNRDTPNFFKVLRDIIQDFNSNFVIITGDFNLIIDPNMDCMNYRNVNNSNAREAILKLMNDFSFHASTTSKYVY